MIEEYKRIKVKKCPFCGYPGHLYHFKDELYPVVNMWFIGCDSKGCLGEADPSKMVSNKETAIWKWNMRNGKDHDFKYDNFQRRLKELRKERGLTIKQVSDALGFKDVRTIQRYECYGITHREPRKANLQKLADFYHVSIDYLTGNEGSYGIGMLPRHSKEEIKRMLNERYGIKNN